MKGAPKNIIRSIRISEDVATMVEGFDGLNFNDKLTNIILFCFWEAPELRREVERLKKRRQRYKADLDLVQAIEAELNLIKDRLQRFGRSNN